VFSVLTEVVDPPMVAGRRKNPVCAGAGIFGAGRPDFAAVVAGLIFDPRVGSPPFIDFGIAGAFRIAFGTGAEG